MPKLESARQIYLAFNLKWRPTFNNFVAGENTSVVEALQSFCSLPEGTPIPSSFFLCGGAGTGKTHLLFASHHLADERDDASLYLDAATLDAADADALVDVGSAEWILFDNIHRLAGHLVLEEALMNCMDRSQAKDCKLFLTSRLPPAEMRFTLPDLASRIQSLPQYFLQDLGEEELAAMLHARAQSGGFIMPDAVLSYFLTRLRKNAGVWMSAYERTEEAALEQSRPLTVRLASEQIKT